MRILFMGSDELACPTLKKLLGRQTETVVGVVTQPDRPKGRRRHLAPCPLKAFAEGAGLPVLSPVKLGAPDAVHEVAALKPDLIVVVAYGQYIKPSILELPPLGAINLHPSLLPKYRGAAPIQMAIAEGEHVTGVTVQYVAEKMDAGDILLQEPVAIGENDTAESMATRLAEAGADLMARAIDALAAGSAPRIPQDHGASTYVHKLTKGDGRMDWQLPAAVIRNRVRGFHPWPGSFCTCPAGTGVQLKVLAVDVCPGKGPPGTVLACHPEGPVIATGNEALCLRRVQPPGKKPMDGAAFLCGHPLHPGDRLG